MFEEEICIRGVLLGDYPGREREHIVKLTSIQPALHPIPFPDMGCSCPQIAASSASLPYGWFFGSQHVLRHVSCTGQYLRGITSIYLAGILIHHDIQNPVQAIFNCPVPSYRWKQTALVSVQPS